jgi:pentatricopeptide repeat protein
LGLIELVYAIYLAFKINTNMVTLIITTISGIICLISSFHIQSIDFASQSIKSMSNNLKIDILEIKADNWKTEGVLVNALCTYIEILNIAPPTSYAYEYNLNKLVDVFEEMKKKGVEVNSLEASNLRKTFKNVPEEFSDIAKKILAAL